MKHLLFALVTLCFGATAQAHDLQTGDLHIIHPAIPLVAENAKSAAGYMVITNDGDTPERLMGVEADFAERVMLHTTEMDDNGVAMMKHLPMLEIPAGETVVLEPGGMHIMLMGLNTPMAEGAMLPATLIFENAGRVEFEFMVDPPASSEKGMDHSHMDHSNH